MSHHVSHPDRSFPRLHPRPAKGWLNDPNGIHYADGRWQETWDRSQSLPQGLEITLTLANSGEITRLFLLTPGGGQ